jgi:hypothetical protein
LLSGLAGRVGESTSSPLDFSSLPGSLTPSTFQTPTFADNLTSGKQFSQEGADAVYNQMTRYLQPQQDQQQKSLEARLGEQGFVPGTAAYNTAMGEFQRNKDLSYADARDRATTQGYGLGNQWFANDVAGRGLQRQETMDANSIADRLYNQNVNSHQLSIQDLLTQRQYPLNEYNAVRSGTQVQNPSVTPSFSTPNLPGVDLMGNAQQNYNNQLGAYNAQTGSQNQLLGSLGQIAAMYFMGSDVSIKENVVRLGTHPKGFGVYSFEYRPAYRDLWGHGPQVGVLAHEVRKVLPAAVMRHPDGYLLVNYGAL